MFSDLRRAFALLELQPMAVVRAVAAGVATLGSALTLAAVSAWLITRAWQMPPVLDLTVAVVAVRALGISRGVFRYLERLATHDTALRGTTSARTRLYRHLADARNGAAVTSRRGDLMSRAGADIDALGDVVVRAVVPICVSAMMMVAAVGLLAFVSIAAASVLLVALLIAGIAAPMLSARAARLAETEGADARARFTETAVQALDHAPELRVAGTLDATLAAAASANRDAVRARDASARPGAFADAAIPLSIGASVLGSLLVGMSMFGATGSSGGAMTPMALAVLVLVPLAAFEATAALPGAAVALTRANLAASRLVRLLDTPSSRRIVRVPVDLSHHAAGSRVAVVGPSGSGKTTLLMAWAGIIPSDITPIGGSRFFAEDAHVFETSILENLRVVRGSIDPGEAVEVLHTVGLGPWIDELDDGVDTTLVGGAHALSGGQRRRLLLARALLSDAPILLLDEPTEHLDDHSGGELLRRLLDRTDNLVPSEKTVVVVTHRLPPDTHADQVIDLTVSLTEKTSKKALQTS